MTYLSADNLTKIQHFPGLGEMMWKWFMKGELVANVTGLVITLWRFWRGELGWTLTPCLKDFLCARPSRKCWLAGISGLSNSCWSNDGCFLGVNDYFHCQNIFRQVQLPPVRNYGQGKVIWSVVNIYVWTWEFMFCGTAKLIKLHYCFPG